jgi:hypothetical protein
MTEAIISDLTGKTVNKKQSYKCDVYSRGNGTHIEFDCEGNDQLLNMIALAVQNGVTWYKIKKDESGTWNRIPQEVQKNA